MMRLVFVLVVLSIRQGNALKCYECDDFDPNEPRCDDVLGKGILSECKESPVEGHPYCMSFDGTVVDTEIDTGEVVFASNLRIKNCSHIDSTRLKGRDCQDFDKTIVQEILVGSEQDLEFYNEEYAGTICFCNDFDGCNGSMRPMVALWLTVASLITTVKFIN